MLVSPATVDLLLSLLAIAAAIGLSLYAALGLPGLASYLGLLDLPGPLVGLAAPYVWGTLLALALLELLISRSRLTDLLWNALHTLARPLAATIFLSAALTDGPHTAQWAAGLTGLGIALLVHMAVLAVHTAARTAGPRPAAPGFTALQLALAAALGTLAWIAPPIAAAAGAVLVLAPLPWSPRLWGAASLVLVAVYSALSRPGRSRHWEVGPGKLGKSLQQEVKRELGPLDSSLRSAPAGLARFGPRWPYIRGRLVVVADKPPLFAHRRGLRARAVHLGRGRGVADEAALLETVEIEADVPYALCVGPSGPGGAAILAALGRAGDREPGVGEEV